MAVKAEIGAVVAIGNSQKEAVEECQRIAQLVEGHYIETKASSLDTANEEIEKLESYGIKF